MAGNHGPVITGIYDLAMHLEALASNPDAGLCIVQGPCGWGKTAMMPQVAALMGVPIFHLNTAIFGANFASAIPVPYVDEKGVRHIDMVMPEYEELKDYVLKLDKTGIRRFILHADEFTELAESTQNQIITKYVDGLDFRRWGLDWKPIVVATCNGKLYGGVGNNNIMNKTRSRTDLIRWVGAKKTPIPIGRYRQDGKTPDPREVDIGDILASEVWTKVRDEDIDHITSMDTSPFFTTVELAENTAGQPRAAFALANAVLEAKANAAKFGLAAKAWLLNSYVPSHFCLKEIPRAQELVVACFSSLPMTVGEVRAIVDGLTAGTMLTEQETTVNGTVRSVIKTKSGEVQCKLPEMGSSNWTAWATSLISKTDEKANKTLAEFVNLCCPFPSEKAEISRVLNDAGNRFNIARQKKAAKANN